jgi:hypothetical protein
MINREGAGEPGDMFARDVSAELAMHNCLH